MRRQQLQVLHAITRPLAEAIDLDDAQAPRLLRDERHAQDGMQAQISERGAGIEALVLLHVLAQKAHAFFEGLAHDGAAIRNGRLVASAARAWRRTINLSPS